MNFLLQRGRAFIIIFTVMSLTSTLFLAMATQNYLKFFPALQGLQAAVSSVNFRPNSSSQQDLWVSIQINNSNDYSGITIGQVTVKFFFFVATNFTNTLFDSNHLIGLRNVVEPLGPKAHLNVNVTYPANLGQVSELTSFVREHSGLVSTEILLRVDFITFLDPATGPTVIQNEQNVPLSIYPPNAIL